MGLIRHLPTFLRKRLFEFAPYFDGYDFVVVGGLFIAFTLSVVIIPLPGTTINTVASYLIKILGFGVASVTLFITYYRQRHPSQRKGPAVRQYIDERKDGPNRYGIKNFGPETVYFLQAELEVRSQNGERKYSETFEAESLPLHLEEQEEIILLGPDRDVDFSISLADIDGEQMVATRRSFLAHNGVRYPMYLKHENYGMTDYVLDRLDEVPGEPAEIPASKILE